MNIVKGMEKVHGKMYALTRNLPAICDGVENVQTDYRNVYGTHKMMTRLILSRHYCPITMERG